MFCSVLKKENANSSLNENKKKGDMLPIIITSNTYIQCFAKGYHIYKHCYLITKIEPSNPVDKYTVSVNQEDLLNRRILAT